MAKANLASQREIGKLPAREVEGHDLYYDEDLRGFGLKVFASGRKVWFIEYGPRGRRRRMSLGDYGPLTPEDARKKAKRELGKVASGADPLEEKHQRKAVPAFGDWVDEYMRGVRQRKKRPELDEMYLSRAKKRWSNRPIDRITADDIEAAMEAEAEAGRELLESRRAKKLEEGDNPKPIAESAGRTTANRWYAAVRSCLEAAWRRGLVSENAAARVQKYRENPPRLRVLDDEELQRVLDAVAEEPDQHDRAAIRLLIETGARKSEVLRAKWEDFDLDRGVWLIPSPKAGTPQAIPLAPTTVGMLRRLKRRGEYVIAGRFENRPRADLKGLWSRIKKAADVPDVTIHDVRRTFGLRAAREIGVDYASRLLRHSDPRITAKVYAPFGVDELRDALEKAKRLGEVLPMPAREN